MCPEDSASLSPISGHGPPALPDDATVISVAGGESAATTAEIGRLLEGAMLGPYRLDRFIGGGGMGAVFRALDTTLDRTVAVKVLAGRRADDEEMLRRFRNEAQSAARLDHENIGRVHAVGSEAGWHYIVFEFIEGTNLRDVVRDQGPLDLARTVDIGVQIADALEHASRRDVVHRDIKPSNIVITPAGRARLVDMGLARLHHVGDDHDLTSSGMTIGTFDYISPEQARDPRAADVRSDLYSLGCTMFFLLAGRAPFADGTMVQKLLQHQQTAPPAIDEVRPDVPRAFGAILERLMAKDPRDRYQRPAQLAADLVAFAERSGFGVVASRPLVMAPPAPPAMSRLPWLLPTLGLAAMVTGLWLRGASERQRIAAVIDEPSTAAPQPPGIIRVVGEPVGNHEVRTIGEALGRVVDGGMIELAYDGERTAKPFSVAGRRLTIQAAEGSRPEIRFLDAVGGGEGRLAAACDVGDGNLVVRRVCVRLDSATRAPGGTCLFAVTGGRIVCEDTILLMAAGGRPDPDEASDSAVRSAFVSAAPGAGGVAAVRLDATRVAGDGCLLDVASGMPGTVSLRWFGGAFVSPQLLVQGGGGRTEPGLRIDCELADVVVASGAGVVRLRDGPNAPIPARLRLTATDCRFLVADAGRPFVEQAGTGDPDTYRIAAVWNDVRSRYEGGGPFLRIDADSGRSDVDFPQGFLRLATSGDRPDPTAWNLPGG